MRNFHFLFAAWMVVWAAFFAYQASVASRVSRLREEVERLKQQMGDN